jgi:hypothetical protein
MWEKTTYLQMCIECRCLARCHGRTKKVPVLNQPSINLPSELDFSDRSLGWIWAEDHWRGREGRNGLIPYKLPRPWYQLEAGWGKVSWRSA